MPQLNAELRIVRVVERCLGRPHVVSKRRPPRHCLPPLRSCIAPEHGTLVVVPSLHVSFLLQRDTERISSLLGDVVRHRDCGRCQLGRLLKDGGVVLGRPSSLRLCRELADVRPPAPPPHSALPSEVGPLRDVAVPAGLGA